MSNIYAIKTHCTENGTGIRTSVYFSGCNNHCPGCFNKEAWDFDVGTPFEEKLQEILDSLKPDYIDGVSILGGEPLDPKNQEDVSKLITAIRSAYGNTKNIWLWTGYYLKAAPKTDSLKVILKEVDHLVEGPFIQEEYSPSLVFKGSANQNILCRNKKGKLVKED